ncbi:hypothetical protein Hdeb2414_s0459g00898431 [Helianthus debilis subsp. tardiflorus]
MGGSNRSVYFLFQFCRELHTLTKSSSPSDAFKKKIAALEKDRRRRNPKRNRLFVETPESLSWLDTASMPMFATVAGIALFAKLLMMVSNFTYLLFVHPIVCLIHTASYNIWMIVFPGCLE